MPEYDLAVIVDPCAPWRLGHAQGVERALRHAPRAMVLLSSAHAARSLRHPFSTAERLALARAACTRWGSDVVVHPVRDRTYQQYAWQAALHEAVAGHAPEGARIVQLCASYHPHAFRSDWTALAAPELDAPDFWAVRAALFGASRDSWQGLLEACPAEVADFLRSFRSTDAWAQLRAEYEDIQATRESWRRAPYAPVLATADALVLHEGHVLLIQRARSPGKGLWALPGGFVDPDETLLDACLRELQEETGLRPDPAAIAGAGTQPAVFDAPHRALRARIVTHVYRFDLAGGPRPAVAGGDDAGAAEWIPLVRFLDMEEQCFEDHFHIARRMLGI